MTESPDLPELILLRDAARLGRSADAILRGARSGALVRIHPGAYMAASDWAQLRPEARLRSRVVASHRLSRRDHVYSHESAAVILGVPLLGALPDRPHVIDASASSRSTPAMHRTVRALDQADIATTGGIRSTSPLSTAIDIAATRSPLGGVIAISGVRYRYDVAVEDLDARAAHPFRGVQRVRAAIATSSAHCQSPLEALVLTRCDDYGFLPPEQQRVIVTARGEFPVDFSWFDGRLVLEADGYVKYLDPAMLGRSSTPESVIDEKLREDAIREIVDRFARTTWADAYAGPPLARTLERLGVPRVRRARGLRY